jgi:hypothetical protein
MTLCLDPQFPLSAGYLTYYSTYDPQKLAHSQAKRQHASSQNFFHEINTVEVLLGNTTETKPGTVEFHSW